MNRLLLSSFLFLFVLALATSCGSSEEQKTHPEEEFILPDTLDTDGMAIVLTAEDKACLSQKDAICEYGLYFVTLGLPMEEVRLPKGVSELVDTLFTAGGYQWWGKVMDFGQGGSITVEGDFVDEGDPAMKLPYSKVNRIRVETSGFQSGGVKVGSPFSRLKGTRADSLFQAIYLPDYRMVDVSLPGLSKIHYNISDENGQIGEAIGNQITRIPVALIPDEALIASIVVTM